MQKLELQNTSKSFMYVNMTHIKQVDSFCYYSRNWAQLLRFWWTPDMLFNSVLRHGLKDSLGEASTATPISSAIVNVDDLGDQ